MDERPIGVIDSGSGGISIVHALEEALPNETIIYIGDHAYAPYSERSQRVIRTRVKKLMRTLIAKRCKLIVVACNTATVAGIAWYRKQFPQIPIVGVVPTVKTAAERTKTKHICVLSTKFTAKSAYLRDLIKKFAGDSIVYSIGSTKLVRYIESLNDQSKVIEGELKQIGRVMKKRKVDVVVLGCTHFPFIKNAIQNFFGSSVTVIDSSAAVARQVNRILINNDITGEKPKLITLYTTSSSPVPVQVMKKLYGRDVVVEHCSIT